ncbi:ABC transporter substrate-binding protein [Halobaculum sp. CBA1158]|uniref:ABC transporter substrate-binding protein n=1 Tax=Halobaculum sp. CBA1158 TaxID=2904243 RepID=UPI001F25BFE0|nr:ABC transporter substrate-binding protein [Halobaculum sp. CBA1158]UIP00459.1 ABC transporter substrate-binding protein [Halobaculum sp. CBA1158]
MTRTERTRRRLLATVASAATVGVAGCGGAGGGTDGTAESATATETPTETAAPTTAAPEYEACMEPVGCLSFDEPPETWVANAGIYCDIGVALGLVDRLAAIGSPRRYYTGYYDELPGVSLDKSQFPALSRGTRMPKESFYAVDADVHVMDPVWMINTFGWTEADVEEIATNIGPFFGNYIREQQDAWHTYPYPTLSEAFGNVAALFGRRERYERIEQVRTELAETIRSRLPEERTEVLLLRPQGVPPNSFFPQYMDDSVSDLQWQIVEVDDALTDSGIPEWGVRIDYETIARIDPEVIVMETQFADDFVLDDDSFREFTLNFMREHPVARDVTAVENGRVHAGGINYQGPLVSLFQTEHAARVAYPDEFGDEELFDRERVAGIVTGEG